MLKRIGVVGIVINEPKAIVDKVNLIISNYSYLITGRMGIPKHEEHVGVIALIVEGNTDEVGALTGKLGNLPGVIVKSALTAKKLINKGDVSSD
ncbi:MAG: putative iron-only hydrogenase system regulator [Firmicutes bacterium]|nr:putative iron-only hydrogenase system regulator [Bacillota bacterium]